MNLQALVKEPDLQARTRSPSGVRYIMKIDIQTNNILCAVERWLIILKQPKKKKKVDQRFVDYEKLTPSQIEELSSLNCRQVLQKTQYGVVVECKRGCCSNRIAITPTKCIASVFNAVSLTKSIAWVFIRISLS